MADGEVLIKDRVEQNELEKVENSGERRFEMGEVVEF